MKTSFTRMTSLFARAAKAFSACQAISLTIFAEMGRKQLQKRQNMTTKLSISGIQLLAVFLAFQLVFSPFAPLAYAQQNLDERACIRDGGVWNGTSCEIPAYPPPAPPPAPTPAPAPTDACPNVPGTQTSGPCADAQCWSAGGVWDGDSCDNDSSQAPSGGNEDVTSQDEVEAAVTDEGTPNSTSSSVANSADVPEEQSDTDNSNHDNEQYDNGPTPPDPNEEDDIVDVSATTTEAAAIDPVFTIDTDHDGTGNRIGGTIFTGDAVASTTLKNILNITKTNVDVPGVTNSSLILAQAENDAELTTDGSANAETGENNAVGGQGSATVVSGKASASADVVNVVNTNFFNSDGIVLFLNPEQNVAPDLSSYDLSYFFEGGPGQSPAAACTILTCLNSADLEVLNKNTADVTNRVSVEATSGVNSAVASSTGDAVVQTGDAYASANVFNMVNTNFINSSYLLVSSNTFGEQRTDIVLPSATFFETLLANGNALPDLNSSSFIVSNNNNEEFFGTTTANATTGGNTASSTGSGFGEVFTGHAYSGANNFTSANQTRVGGSSVYFAFRVWGNWSGSVRNLPRDLAWRSTRASDNKSTLIEIYSNGRSGAPRGNFGVYNSSSFLASSTNMAHVQTDVNVLAMTGQNSAEVEHGVAAVSTGDAYAAANVVNMVNTNIVNRNWVFGVYNIFGDFKADIDFGSQGRPDLRVATAATPNTTTSGGEVTYQFTVANDGAVAANNATLEVEYDKNRLSYTQGTSGSTDTSVGRRWNLGTVAPGASMNVSFTARVEAADIASGASLSLPLVARVASSQTDLNTANNTREVTISVAGPGGAVSPSPQPPSPPPSPPAGGGGGGTTTTNPAPPPPAKKPAGGGGGGGGGGNTATTTRNTSPIVFVSASSIPGVSTANPVANPKITITKTATVSASSTPSSIVIDYKVVVYNDKEAKAAHNVVLKDTLYDPSGKDIYTRSWNLGSLVSGDQVTLTYSIAFDVYTTKPGTYRNEADITGQRNKTTEKKEIQRIPSRKAVGNVTFALSNAPGVQAAAVGGACSPLAGFLQMGSTNTAEVIKLQQFLNREVAAGLPTSGIYGSMTAAAVSKFQQKYASEILAPAGLSMGTGSVYTSTLRKINSLCGGATVALTPSTPIAASPVAAKPATPKPAAKPAAKQPAAASGNSFTNALGGWFSQFTPKSAPTGQ